MPVVYNNSVVTPLVIQAVQTDYGFENGTYQSIQTYTPARYKVSSTATISFTNQLYKVLELRGTCIRCEPNFLYVQSFSNIEVGYFDINNDFITVGSGSRIDSNITMTIDIDAIIHQSAFMIMKDLDTDNYYLVCNYYFGTVTKSGIVSNYLDSTSLKYGRPYENATIPLNRGNSTNINISKPYFRWSNTGISSDNDNIGICIK